MIALRRWNVQQIRVFDRYSRIHRMPLTPEAVAHLGGRYAEKHSAERLELVEPQRQGAEVGPQMVA